jgi:hypothetical protein
MSQKSGFRNSEICSFAVIFFALQLTYLYIKSKGLKISYFSVVVIVN